VSAAGIGRQLPSAWCREPRYQAQSCSPRTISEYRNLAVAPTPTATLRGSQGVVDIQIANDKALVIHNLAAVDISDVCNRRSIHHLLRVDGLKGVAEKVPATRFWQLRPRSAYFVRDALGAVVVILVATI
jgi:hypothetical protein